MVTLSSADNALKTLYLDVVAEQLDTSVSPFYAKIQKTTNDVWGKEIRKLAQYGVNGGVGAGTEDGDLPESAGNNYKQFCLTLKNLYGTIEISDKAVRASENNVGAFVNLLNAEMEGLINASKFNFGRMLYGDGSGTLASVEDVTSGVIEVDNPKWLVEGMVIDFRTSAGVAITGATGRRILAVNKDDYTITVSGTTITSTLVPEGSIITVQGSYNQEITGLGAIFKETGTLYGLSRTDNPWLVPVIGTNTGNFSSNMLQKAIDKIEENSGSKIDLILCSYGVKRAIVAYYENLCTSLDTSNDITLGHKEIAFNGIPIVADRFCPDGTLYMLNTKDFELHQLCDWQWLEGEDGKIIKQVAGKPVYSATLVKYADLLCTRPCGQGMLSGINEC